jgi:hypothetical protein
MAKTDLKSVDEYIATHSEDVQAILQRVRSTIRRTVPGGEEVISYQIPRQGGPSIIACVARGTLKASHPKTAPPCCKGRQPKSGPPVHDACFPGKKKPRRGDSGASSVPLGGTVTGRDSHHSGRHTNSD